MRPAVLVFTLAVTSSWAPALGQTKSAPRQPSRDQAPARKVASPPRTPVAPQAPSQPRTSARATTPDEKPIRDLIAAFTKAYNAGDAKAIASMFTVGGEAADEKGNVARGRAEIERIFAAVFQEHPQAKITIKVDSIRFLGPTVAIEEGVSTVVRTPGEPGESGRYSVTYVVQDGKWLMAAARELAADDEQFAASELEQLGWLVGNWIDESSEGLVKSSYRWDEKRHFIMGEFTLQVSGQTALSGTQRIGWDPRTRQLRSWVFDSEGGFGEGLWTRQGDRWIVKFSGVAHDGHSGSMTNIYTRLGKDKYSMESRDRVVGGELTQDAGAVVVVREPPPAKK